MYMFLSRHSSTRLIFGTCLSVIIRPPDEYEYEHEYEHERCTNSPSIRLHVSIESPNGRVCVMVRRSYKPTNIPTPGHNAEAAGPRTMRKSRMNPHHRAMPLPQTRAPLNVRIGQHQQQLFVNRTYTAVLIFMTKKGGCCCSLCVCVCAR